MEIEQCTPAGNINSDTLVHTLFFQELDGNSGFVDTFTGAIKIPKCQNTKREQPFKVYNQHVLIEILSR